MFFMFINYMFFSCYYLHTLYTYLHHHGHIFTRIRAKKHMILVFRQPKAGTSWTAQSSDFGQNLIIDLGNVRNITRIAIQGRPHSTEYVTEFTISYGYNGLDFTYFRESGGNFKVTLQHHLASPEPFRIMRLLLLN